MAKSNHGVISGAETTVLVNQVGDPSKLSFLDNLKDEGEFSIILVDLSMNVGIRTYEILKNMPDKFSVVLEEDHSGRHSVYVVIRYVRKTECRLEDLVPELKTLLATPLQPKSKKSLPKKRAKKAVSKKAVSKKRKKKKAKAEAIGF